MSEREKTVETIIRTATVTNDMGKKPEAERIARYLPSNYQAVQQPDGSVLIVGTDRAGWTLHDYVIPRLASGLIRAVEGYYIEVPPLSITYRDGEVASVTATVEGVQVPVAATVADWERAQVDVVEDEIVDVPQTYAV